MVTKIDNLGRIGVSKSLRKAMNWMGETALEIRRNEETGEIILKSIEKKCICCGAKEDVVPLSETVFLCRNCAKEKFGF